MRGQPVARAAGVVLPPLQGPLYGYEAVNVEAQNRDPHSLLNWMRRMLALRRQHHAFGRGTLRFLSPENPRVLAFVRQWEDERILVVANLSRFAQHVELDLSASASRGRTRRSSSCRRSPTPSTTTRR